jgi:hypothetical protein
MTIRQIDLERLRRLIRQKDQAHDQYQALRADLIERYLEGAVVEPGHWDLRVTEMEYRQFTQEQLERILGVREAERLKARMTPRKRTTLNVIQSRGRQSS